MRQVLTFATTLVLVVVGLVGCIVAEPGYRARGYYESSQRAYVRPAPAYDGGYRDGWGDRDRWGHRW